MSSFLNWLVSNWANWLSSFVGGLIASLAAIVIWEKYRQPRLTIELPKEGPAIQTLADGTVRISPKSAACSE